jgi:beta-xylosidase
MLKVFAPILLLLLSVNAVWAQSNKWGDQHNGTYANPILPGDFQASDVIRVHSDYYYIAATNQLSPGILILTSKDLVNWTIVGHAVDDITQISAKYNYDKMQTGSGGINAGCISYHDGKFYIYFTDADEGVFMTSAEKITGPWKPAVPVLKGKGWDTPSVLWDDDKQLYMAVANDADGYKAHLFKISNNGEQVLPGFDNVIHQGKASEANKLYKIKSYYYHFYNEVSTEGRVPFIERSKNITGPYTERRQLMHKADHEPNRGSLVETEKGGWYFIAQNSQPRWDGYETNLLPVTWINDWPTIGTVSKDGIGEMSLTGQMPLNDPNVQPIQTTDDFGNKTLSAQWEWFCQPDNAKWNLTERPGFIRLYAHKPLQPGGVSKTPNVLTQRVLRQTQNIATVKFDIAHMTDGQIAALSLFGKTSGMISVIQNGNSRRVYFNAGGKTMQGTQDIDIDNIWLRAIWNANGLTRFYCSTDGVNYDPFGEPYAITNFSNNMGAKIGIYTSNESPDNGYIDVDWFHYGVN